MLGVPRDEGWIIACSVSFGYPRGRWAIAPRRPAHEVAFRNHWGAPVGIHPRSPALVARVRRHRRRLTCTLPEACIFSVARGCSSMVEPLPSKQITRVRFPSAAPMSCRTARGTDSHHAAGAAGVSRVAWPASPRSVSPLGATVPSPPAGASTTSTTVATVPSANLPAGPTSWTVYHGDSPAAASDVAHRGEHQSSGLDVPGARRPALRSAARRVRTSSSSRPRPTGRRALAATGAVALVATVGAPVPSGSLPCGTSSPTVGITGTPVRRPALGELFVVADELVGGRPRHVLIGLCTATGAVVLTDDVDPAGFRSAGPPAADRAHPRRPAGRVRLRRQLRRLLDLSWMGGVGRRGGGPRLTSRSTRVPVPGDRCDLDGGCRARRSTGTATSG